MQLTKSPFVEFLDVPTNNMRVRGVSVSGPSENERGIIAFFRKAKTVLVFVKS